MCFTPYSLLGGALLSKAEGQFVQEISGSSSSWQKEVGQIIESVERKIPL